MLSWQNVHVDDEFDAWLYGTYLSHVTELCSSARGQMRCWHGGDKSMSLFPDAKHICGCFGDWVGRIGDWTLIYSLSLLELSSSLWCFMEPNVRHPFWVQAPGWWSWTWCQCVLCKWRSDLNTLCLWRCRWPWQVLSQRGKTSYDSWFVISCNNIERNWWFLPQILFTTDVSSSLSWGVMDPKVGPGKMLSDPLLVHHRYIHTMIAKTLKAKWSKRWSSLEIGWALKDILPRAVKAWTVLDIAMGSLSTTLIGSWCLVGHCHISTFCVLWDLDECVV